MTRLLARIRCPQWYRSSGSHESPRFENVDRFLPASQSRRSSQDGLRAETGDASAPLMRAIRHLSPTAMRPASLTAMLIVVYLSTRTADYFWDGITFALHVEKVAAGQRGIALLFHQNHLLYEVFGYVLYWPARAAGLNVRALTLLQIANSILGAVAAGFLFAVVNRITRSRKAAAASAAALAFSATWWKLSTDADAYVPAVLLLLICLNNLTSERPRWTVAGLALGIAMLTHQLACLFSLAAIASVFASRHIERKFRFAAATSALAWTVSIGVYYACAITLHGMWRFSDVMRWVTSNPSLITPSANPIPGILSTPRANLDLIVGHSFSLFRSEAGLLELTFTAVAILAGIAFLVRLPTVVTFDGFIRTLREAWLRHKRVIGMLFVWICPYLTFLCFFESGDPYLRLFYAPALAIAFGIALSMVRVQPITKSRAPLAALQTVWLLVGAFAFFNLSFFIEPHMRSESNPVVAAARQAGDVWDERTVVYFLGHNEADTTFEYFNERTKWERLSSTVLDGLADEIELMQTNGRTVWLNKGATESGRLFGYTQGKELRVDVSYAPARYIQLLPRMHVSAGVAADQSSFESQATRAR